MLQQLRPRLRAIGKRPAFTAVAILTLALGIGVTSAVFSLVQGVLLTPPPYRHPEQLVLVSPFKQDGTPFDDRGWAPDEWLDWQQHANSFQSIAAYGWTFNFLVRHDGSESLEGMVVTPSYFRLTGLKPLLGRAFTESEGRNGSKSVILLGYDLWRRRFNSDPSIVGKTIRISRMDTPPQVVGIMPPGIRFLPDPTVAREPNYDPNALVDFWLPGAPDPSRLKQPGWNVIARLRGGSSLKRAQAELTLAIASETRTDKDLAGITARLQPLRTELNASGSTILWPLLGAAMLVLLIACGNAASLMLIRGLQRQSEYAVRAALGIRRKKLLWLATSESLVIAACGGIVGIVLAFAITRVFKLVGGRAIPRLDAVTADWPVLICGFAAALFSALLAGLIPAIRATQISAAEVLKSAGPKSSAARGERRLLRGVAIAQTALTLVLMMGAGVLIRTMENIANVSTGYDTSHILTMSVTAMQNMTEFHRRALERVAAVPGVQYAAFAWGVPLTGNSWPDAVQIEGQPIPAKESDRIRFPLRSVTTDYFKLMHMRIVDGRNVRSSDEGKQVSVAVVNQTFADRYFPHQNPIGKKLWLSGPPGSPSTSIVGVVTDARSDDLTQGAHPEIYLSFWQATPFSKHLVLRTAGDPRYCALAVQRELRSIDPTVAVENVKTMEEIRDDSLAARIFATRLLSGFSLVGTALTLIGIYGVVSLSVASRRREIAIRTAVGARPSDIRTMVFAEGFRLMLFGLVIGGIGAIAVSRLLRSFLFHVDPMDPTTLLVSIALFVSIVSLACWLPSRRAAKVNPIESLRYE